MNVIRDLTQATDGGEVTVGNDDGLGACDIRDVLNLQIYLSNSKYLLAFASLPPRITA